MLDTVAPNGHRDDCCSLLLSSFSVPSGRQWFFCVSHLVAFIFCSSAKSFLFSAWRQQLEWTLKGLTIFMTFRQRLLIVVLLFLCSLPLFNADFFLSQNSGGAVCIRVDHSPGYASGLTKFCFCLFVCLFTAWRLCVGSQPARQISRCLPDVQRYCCGLSGETRQPGASHGGHIFWTFEFCWDLTAWWWQLRSRNTPSWRRHSSGPASWTTGEVWCVIVRLKDRDREW